MKALGEELFAPFADIDGMMYKVGRIYRDENFAPYLHYRDTMWIYVRYDAWYWSKTPTLYFELSPEGAEFGFRISKPEAAVMERFRSGLLEDPEPFLNMVDEIVEKYGLTVGGDEYKRKKPCPEPKLEPKYSPLRSLFSTFQYTLPVVRFENLFRSSSMNRS